MKKVYFLIIFLAFLTCLTSCVDVEERYDFKADGSCNVAFNFDMSHAVAVLMNLMPDSVKSTPQFNMRKDTSINFYAALPDSSQRKLNTQQIDLARKSTLNVNMNLQKNVMKVSINHQAKNASELQYYLQNLTKLARNSQLRTVTQTTKNIKELDAGQVIGGEDFYIYEVTSHRFCRIIDKSKFNAFLKKTQSTLAMAKALLIDAPYKVVLNFAKPVKKVNNPKAIVSADRKHVTLVTNIDEMIKNPSVTNLQVDY